jgi:co-chaperonin GroES (HSP10)
MADESEAVAPPTEEVLWQPLYDKLIVRRLPEAEAIGRFLVPEKHRKLQNVGVVLRVGNGRWIDGVLYPLTIREGHLVIFSHYAGMSLEGHDDVVVLREDEILAYQEG